MTFFFFAYLCHLYILNKLPHFQSNFRELINLDINTRERIPQYTFCCQYPPPPIPQTKSALFLSYKAQGNWKTTKSGGLPAWGPHG